MALENTDTPDINKTGSPVGRHTSSPTKVDDLMPTQLVSPIKINKNNKPFGRHLSSPITIKPKSPLAGAK